jgi:Fe-S-cluster-containing hydrogenase component 2
VNIEKTPLQSLIQGRWFKLICGASFQDLPTIRSLAIAYSLAGVDCIDVAADPAVINAVKEGLKVAKNLAIKTQTKSVINYQKPWLMVSLNDGEDPHFRKAQFDPLFCPVDCPRPCVKICPAHAIQFNQNNQGIIDQKCYGCGRCIPICPLNLIETRSYISTPKTIISLIQDLEIDAIEIHTQVGHEKDFKRLWQDLKTLIPQLKLLAISCQDHENVIDYLNNLSEIIFPLNCALIWQTDGRPMSGDIGIGTTHPAIKMAQKAIQAKIKGFIQLAGGTNQYTVKKLQEKNLLKTENLVQENAEISQRLTQNFPYVSGVAYGSYARSLLTPILEQLEISEKSIYLEENDDLLWQSVKIASELVKQIKGSPNNNL